MSDTENQEIEHQEIEHEVSKEVPVETAETNDEPKPVSTRDAIKSALKEAKEKDENPKTAAKTEHTKPVRTAKDDKAGKTVADPAVQDAPQAAKPLEAPKSWPTADRAEFSKLPAPVQTRLLELEKQRETAIGKAGQAAEFGNRIEKIVTPYAALITSEGGTPEKAIQDLMNSAYVLRRGTPQEKARLVIKTMQQFGIDLRQAGNMQQPAQPNVNELIQKGVQTELQKFQEQQQLQSATREWQTFRDDPAHPHIDLVTADMQALLNGGRAQTYQEAYDKAVWAHPELRSTLIEQSAESRNAELKKQNDARRRAGSSISGAPGKTSPTPTTKTGKTTADDIRLAIAQVRGSDY